MALFIDRLPLHAWTPGGLSATAPRWSVSLPIVACEPGAVASPPVQWQRWVMDTAFTGEAFAWRHHLQEVGLNPDTGLSGPRRFAGVFGPVEDLPVRDADLWLFSNIPALRDKPWRIELGEGIAFRNVPRLPNPELNTPLIGIRALRRAGLRVLIDFAHSTVSTWTPGPWYAGFVRSLQRILSRYRTLPMPWARRK